MTFKFTMPPSMRPEPSANSAGVVFESGYSDKPIVTYNCPESIFQIQYQNLVGIFNNDWRQRLILLYADPNDGMYVWSIGCAHDQSRVIVARERVDGDYAKAIEEWKLAHKVYSRA